MRSAILVTVFATLASAIVLPEHEKRLNKDVSVAVIEPGSYYQITNPVLSSTPAGCAIFSGGSATDTSPLVDWGFMTAPMKGGNGRSVHYARGKCLGGSSARNYMVYHRPDTGSMQQWADLVGDDSYTFGNMLPYFQKSITFTQARNDIRGSEVAVPSSSSIGGNGPLQVSYANYGSPFSAWVGRSFNEIGIPTSNDFNSGELHGAQFCSSTIDPKKQKRDSSQTSFLEAAKWRSNLKVYSITKARKIVFDQDRRAVGVELPLGIYLSVRKEVIVSAGAFQSPQMLMVSGVGPRDELARHGIPLVADRPGVGQNMTDHIFFAPSYRVKVETFTKIANSLIYIGWQFATKYLFKRGPLTNPIADFVAWERVPSDLISPEIKAQTDTVPSSWPHIEYIAAPGHIGAFQSLLSDQPKDGHQYASIMCALVAPFSRGSVSLTSGSMDDKPIIDPNWFTHPVDVAVGVAAFKRARQAFASKAMAGVLADPNEYFPGAHVQSDQDITEVIRNNMMTVWHAATTCRMGRVDDPTAVVDSHARVIGVKGLRVVDASSFALLPPGHPQSVVYAFAEKIADDIKHGR